MNTRKIIKEEKIFFQGNHINILYKKIKNINLKIRTDGSISLSVPFKLKKKEIYNFLELKNDWIINNKSKFKEVRINNYKNGDTIDYLGSEYFLEIKEIENKTLETEKVLILDKILKVFVLKKNNNPEYIKKVIGEWYEINLYDILTKITEIWAKYLNIEYKEIKIKKLKSSWGICNISKKRITYSLELAKKQMKLIEYVVVHELAHFRYNNHGKEFKALLDKLIPDWKQRKKELNNFNII